MKPGLLLVDDEPDVRLSFSLYLSRTGFVIHEAGSLAEARRALLAESVECVILDLNLPDGNGLDWLPEVREVRPGTAIIVITGKGDIPLAVEAMRRGADHFLTKPVNMSELDVFLRKGLEVRGLRRRSDAQKRLARHADPCFGESPPMKQLLELASLAAENDAPVLLDGETGSGKGVLARWIHERSARQSMPFVELSCAGLRGELLSSELFGHTRGAFTSAVADRQGLIEVADGGTLFLDEVGELDPSVQPQFLKVLEEKRYRRLGDVRERRSEFRLICATNRDLDAEIEAGRFRADLHFRINVFPVSLPPLRERHEDVPALVAHMLASLGAHNAVLTPATMKRLKEHSWPGNVRELKNAIERALLVARGAPLEPEHFTWLESVSLEPQTATPEGSEADRIRQALDAHDGRVEEAAKALGMSRATLYRRLKKARAN